MTFQFISFTSSGASTAPGRFLPPIPSSVPVWRKRKPQAHAWTDTRFGVAGTRRRCGGATSAQRGQAEDEPGAGGAAGVQHEVAAMGARELARDGQPQAGALVLGGEERREHRIALRGRDAV